MRKFTLMLSLLLLLTALTGCGSKDMLEADLWVLDEEKHIVICLDWDTEQPFVEIIAPDGKKYDPEKLGEDYVLPVGSGLMLRILNAPAGQWKMRYDKRGNEYIDLSYLETTDNG
ncbi:hypothetical protein LJC60_04080 [Ruminococcaceae bacterium OttesenSCG-928-D13]|nr:hypothetical protein [Ruminococcaceae bacterium OttesenSCG-928-D13]